MARKKKLNVLLAERNPLVISALCNLIGRDDRFDFVEGIQSGEAFIRAIEGTRPAFDVAIVADGWTNLQIATRTGTLENTVKYGHSMEYASPSSAGGQSLASTMPSSRGIETIIGGWSRLQQKNGSPREERV